MWTTGQRQLWRECWTSMQSANLSTLICLHCSQFLMLPSFRCIMDGKYQQAMGIAIECRRLDKLEEAITRSDNVHGTLSYCINVSHAFVSRREYRREVRRTKDLCFIFIMLYCYGIALKQFCIRFLVMNASCSRLSHGILH